MTPRAYDRHPLDTDLFDLVEGALDAPTARIVEEHLTRCVLCRIKRQRLLAAPPIDFTDLRDVDAPSFGAIETVDAPLDEVRAGDLWLTAGDESTMVLIRKVLDPDLGVVTVPVIFDVEVADSGTLVLDASTSPLGVPIAIYDGMLSGLPTRMLQSRVVPLRPVDLLQLGAGDPGVTRGSDMEGLGDPRHEVRQYIADRLTQLAPLDDDDDEKPRSPDRSIDPPTAVPGTDFPMFRQDLSTLEGGDLTIESCPELTGCPPEWIALGEIHRRYQTLAVIGTPAGLISDSDFVAARAWSSAGTSRRSSSVHARERPSTSTRQRTSTTASRCQAALRVDSHLSTPMDFATVSSSSWGRAIPGMSRPPRTASGSNASTFPSCCSSSPKRPPQHSELRMSGEKSAKAGALPRLGQIASWKSCATHWVACSTQRRSPS